jgi:hypothetical protein
MFSMFKKSTAHKIRFNYRQIFTVEVPQPWRQNDNPNYLFLSDPTDTAAVSGNAFAKKEGDSLGEFAAHRFASVAEFYSQIGNDLQLHEKGKELIIREFEGTWPDETEPTYYVVACIELDSAYVSLAVTTTPQEFRSNKKMYMEILTSVEPLP